MEGIENYVNGIATASAAKSKKHTDLFIISGNRKKNKSRNPQIHKHTM